MLYVDTRFLRVDWDEDLRCVCTEWKAFYAEGEEYRSALDKVLELLETKRSKKLLGDGRRMKVISKVDQDWVESVWMPRSAQVGLRYSALLLPTSAVTQMSLNQIMKKYKLPDASSAEVLNAYFDSVDKARQWLASQPT